MSDYHKKLCIEQGKQIAVLEAKLAMAKEAADTLLSAIENHDSDSPEFEQLYCYANTLLMNRQCEGGRVMPDNI